MFTASLWRTENRQLIAVVRHLYSQLGIEVKTEDWNLKDDRGFAAALAYTVGALLLDSSIDEAATQTAGPGSSRRWRYRRRPSRRWTKAAWQRVTPEGGSRAAVFLTLGTAATLSRELVKDVPQEPVENARARVLDAYSPPAEDINEIEATRDRMANSGELDAGQAALSYRALELAGAQPGDMPAFEPVGEVDPSQWSHVPNLEWSLALTFGFATSWGLAQERYVDLAVPPVA